MDPVSAIVSIVSFGFTIVKKINDVRKDIKGAPDQVRALQQSCGSIQLILLTTLDTTTSRAIPCTPEAVPHLQCLCASARECLVEVNTVINKVTTPSTATTGRGGSATIKVPIKKWLIKKNDIDEASKRLKELEGALMVMVNFMHSLVLLLHR